MCSFLSAAAAVQAGEAVQTVFLRCEDCLKKIPGK